MTTDWAVHLWSHSETVLQKGDAPPDGLRLDRALLESRIVIQPGDAPDKDFVIQVAEDAGPRSVNRELLLSLWNKKRQQQKKSTAKVVPPLKLRIKSQKKDSPEEPTSVSSAQPQPVEVPAQKEVVRSESKKRVRISETADPGVSSAKKVKPKPSTSTATDEPVTSTPKQSATKFDGSRSVVSAIKRTISKLVGVPSATKLGIKHKMAKSTSVPSAIKHKSAHSAGVSSVTTKTKPKPATAPTALVTKLGGSSTPSASVASSSSKDKPKKKKQKSEKEHSKTKIRLTKEKAKELRKRAKQLAKQISKGVTKVSKRPHATPVEGLLKKAKFSTSFKKPKFGTPIKKKEKRRVEDRKELFTRKSILDQKASPASGSSSLKNLFGLGSPAKPIPAPAPAQPVQNAFVGRCHSFVGNGGHRNRRLRSAGAMVVPLRRPKDLVALFDNLSAKVTKAVRQNGGFKTIENPLYQANSDAEPRFAQRKSHRQFTVPSLYADGRKVAEKQNWQGKDVGSMKEKSLTTFFDSEMRAMNAGRTLAEDVVIVSKNVMHLYLSGLNSEYGDTANLESDLRRGHLTPAKAWIKPKPYVEMVINGLKSRGRPHITYVPPEEPVADVNVQSESGQVSGADGGMIQSEGSTLERRESGESGDSHGASNTPMDISTSVSPPVSAIIPPSPTASFPSASPAQVFDEFGRPIYGEFGAGFAAQYRPRPPLLPPPKPPPSGYCDFQTRIW